MIVVVLHEPQDLVNIAHVVRGMKNFGVRDLRLVNPREYEAYRVEGIAHQTQDVLARVRTYATLEAALADCVRSEEHTSELQSQSNLVCRLLLEKKKKNNNKTTSAPHTVRT